MRILWAIFGIKMYALWYLHPSAKTKKTKAAALPMIASDSSTRSGLTQFKDGRLKFEMFLSLSDDIFG